MKKFVLLFFALVISVVSFGQDPGPIIDPSLLDTIYLIATGFIPHQILAAILLGGWILDTVLAEVKVTSANSTVQLVVLWAKKIARFLALKKK